MAKRSAPVVRPVVMGLLQAIRSNFADDSHRLILADWLDENGDPDRAEYLRLDVQMRWMVDTDPACVPLAKRAQELETAQKDNWLGALNKTVGNGWFYRGLIHLGVSYEDALKPKYDRLADTEELAWVGLVQFKDELLLQQLPELLARPWLTRVAGVALDNVDLRRAGVEMLAAAPIFANMTRLDLETNRLSSEAIRILLASPHLSNLTYLDLSHNPFGDAGARAVATSPVISHLAWLFLEDCNIRERGARALARAPSAPRSISILSTTN